MFKRTKGYLLLTMLVLTGLAGRTHTETLSSKERRSLIKELKTTNAAFFESIDGLSGRQLDFMAPGSKRSIRDCIYSLASIENSLWQCARQSLDNGDAPAKQDFSDEQLPALALQDGALPCKDLEFKNDKEALKLCKSLRSEMLRYLNTSTQNVRAHVYVTKAGNVDAYQLMVLATVFAKDLTDQINRIKSSPGFPE